MSAARGRDGGGVRAAEHLRQVLGQVKVADVQAAVELLMVAGFCTDRKEPSVKERVRAILITPGGNLLTIKRVRPRMEPYWVLPGGGVERDDVSLEAALHREVREEVAGVATIHSLIHVLEQDDRQYFFLARIHTWDADLRSGPEFTDPTRGRYLVEEIPLTPAGIARIVLKPEPVAELLAEHAADVFQLADLRQDRRRSGHMTQDQRTSGAPGP
ncbi:NUDIX domain-containing protein [Streptosporangium sp. NPDC087985]|uniref:NUDIX hydrolase n=1 Tax=Streptosporangium sp. NPDC087985 TaxID=3366196 RepID=UPI00381A17E1